MSHACLVPVSGYNGLRMCFATHIITSKAQLDVMHAAHWRRQEASYISLGPRQEHLLRQIIADPGHSMNYYIWPHRSRHGAQDSMHRLVGRGLVTIGNGPGQAWSLQPTALGLHWADISRPWKVQLNRWGRCIPVNPATGERFYARPPRQATPQAALDWLIARAEHTSDYELRERLIDEVGLLVAEQIRRVTGRTPDLDDEDEDRDSEFAGVDNGFLATIGD
jgi:hypothetical protein